MNSSTPKHKQSENVLSLARHKTINDEQTAMEHNDKEIFLKQIFLVEPEKGCELLFKRYYAVLCNHAVRLVYSKELAEDIVSEVFLKFWKGRSFENITISYRAYLFQAVRNTALNQLKKEFGSLLLDDQKEDLLYNEALNPFLAYEAIELGQQLEKTIQSLPSKCQTVFLMSRLEGKRNAAIAQELNISIKAVEAHITKALSQLRNSIQKRNP